MPDPIRRRPRLPVHNILRSRPTPPVREARRQGVGEVRGPRRQRSRPAQGAGPSDGAAGAGRVDGDRAVRGPWDPPEVPPSSPPGPPRPVPGPLQETPYAEGFPSDRLSYVNGIQMMMVQMPVAYVGHGPVIVDDHLDRAVRGV